MQPTLRHSQNLTARQAHAIIAAAGHAFCIGRPLNLFVTIHLNQSGSIATHAFVTGFFKLTGDWLRHRTKEPPYYVWVLENEIGKGLHLHALVRVPPELQSTYRSLAKNWLQKLGQNPRANALNIKSVHHAHNLELARSKLSVWKYLGFWGKLYHRDGLKGALGYMLKGLDTKGCSALGIGHQPQGVVTGKRCGFSQVLGPTERARAEAAWRTTDNRYTAIVYRSPELRRRRFLLHAGLLKQTDYEPTN